MGFEILRPENEADWLLLRTKVLTATDMAVILGLNPYKSVSELLESKKNPEPFSNAYTWIGQALEPVVVKAVSEVLTHQFKLYEDDGKQFFADLDVGLGATPDAYEVNGNLLLECKTTKPGNALKWAAWPPTYYLSQLYTQLICTEKQSGLLGILSTNLTQTSEVLRLPLTIHHLTRSKELDILILEQVARFWETTKRGKIYRVDRKLTFKIDMMLRYLVRGIYE